MSRFYVTPESIVNDSTIIISGNRFHHIKDVMRLKEGDSIVAFNGKGKEFVGIIEKISPREARVRVKSVRKVLPLNLPKITLVCAVPKQNKMDYIIQKTTELGVSIVIPIQTERTIVKLNEAKKVLRLKRWNKIAIEASQQCGRWDIPKIENITSFKTALKSVKNHPLKLIACLDEETKDLKSVLPKSKISSMALFIGPEGDFSPSEMGLAKKEGCKLVSLGPTVLKCDTAAIATVAILTFSYL